MSAGTLAGERFIRLFGDIDFARPVVSRTPPAPQPPLTWRPLPDVEEHPELDEHVTIASDWQQPAPLSLQILFEPDPEGIYDVQWMAPVGSRLAAGDPLVRCYRTSDGLAITQASPFALEITDVLLERNRRVVRGDALCRCRVPSVSVDTSGVEAIVRDSEMRVAQAVNAVIKGVMGALGESGQVTNSVDPIEVALTPEDGLDALFGQILAACAPPRLEEGDILVVSEKVIAIAQGRLFPLALLYGNDPKTTDREGREDLLAAVREHVPEATAEDLLCADVLGDGAADGLATAGVTDPNEVCAQLARAIAEAHGVRCDVVISDTDTGLDVRETLIGMPTVGATPLGATAGLVIYECLRVANAAEFVRGSHRGIPLVVCRPHPRRRWRDGLGQPRGYAGRLDAGRERLVGFA